MVLVAAFATPLLATTGSLGATTRGHRVVTQFQPPASGQIEVIAVTFSARFSGKTAPPHPITNVTLPGASKPHNYGLLYGSHLIRVSGKVANYVWLTMALKPLGERASHDQPLVGELRNIPEFYNHGLHVEAQRLTINNDDEAQLVQFSASVRADGVIEFSVIDPRSVATYNNFNWNLNPIPSSAPAVWNAVGSLIENPQLNSAAVVQRVSAILHANFLSGGSTPTAPGSTSGPSTGTSGSTSSGALSVTCPSSVTQGQSIEITIHVPTPSEPVKVNWTLPSGSTVLHTAIPNTTNPTTEHDAIGTSEAGTWKALLSAQGQTATCPAITVNGG